MSKIRKPTAIFAIVLIALRSNIISIFGTDPIKLKSKAPPQCVILNCIQIVNDQPGYSGTGYTFQILDLGKDTGI